MLAAGAFVGGSDLGMGDVSLLRVDAGVQVISVEASSLRESNVGHVVSRLLALAREEGGRLVVSLALVEDMTSAGVGGLVRATDQVAAMGGKLVLVGLQDDLAEVLRSTGLMKRLHVAESVTEGMKTARKGRGLFSGFGRAA